MKNFLIIVLAAGLVSAGCSKGPARDEQKPVIEQDTATVQSTSGIRIGYFTVPPHIWKDSDGKMQGALYDLIQNHIAPEMGVVFEWEASPSTIPRQVETLQKGGNYIAALLTKSPDREAMAIYKDPFFLSQSALVVLKDNPLSKITKVSDVAGLTIGYAEKAFISPFLRDDSVTFDLVGDPNMHEINFGKLLKNRISAVYAPDKAGLLAVMKELNLESKVKILDLPEKPAGFYFVFSKDLAGLADKYQAAFDKLNGTALYMKLLAEHLDTSQL